MKRKVSYTYAVEIINKSLTIGMWLHNVDEKQGHPTASKIGWGEGWTTRQNPKNPVNANDLEKPRRSLSPTNLWTTPQDVPTRPSPWPQRAPNLPSWQKKNKKENNDNNNKTEYKK